MFSHKAFLVFVVYHLICINIAVFFAYGADKRAAKRGEWRIPEAQLHALEFLGGSWFVKDTVLYNQYKDDHGGSWKVTSRWLYDGRYADAFYELSPRVAEYLDDNIVPAFERSGKRVGIFISHDLLIIPVVALVSDNSIDMNYYTSKKWLNYLAGFAIVLKPDGKRRIYAVKGLDAGTMKKE